MQEPVPFSEVGQAELRAIRQRRRFYASDDVPDTTSATPSPGEAARNQPQGESAQPQAPVSAKQRPIDQDLNGLALSGGGIRSASFNLGLVQALDRHGVFSQIDYMSTVSGGGYIGGYVSSLSLDDGTRGQEGHSAAAADGTSRGEVSDTLDDSAQRQRVSKVESNITPLAPRAGQPQPKLVRQLVYSGDFLKTPLQFVNRHMFGWVFISIFWVSGVFALTSGFAWLTRYLYTTGPRSFLFGLGFGDDITMAFFPSFILGILWMVAWLISFWRDRDAARGTLASFILALFIASILLGFALVIGTGDIDPGRVSQMIGVTVSKDTLATIGEWLKVAVVVPTLLLLVPYLRPSRLLESGLNPNAKWWERAVFKLAGVAMLVGVPLLVFGFVAREDISQWNQSRSGLLYYYDVNWEKLWSQLSAADKVAVGESDYFVEHFLLGRVERLDQAVLEVESNAADASESEPDGSADKKGVSDPKPGELKSREARRKIARRVCNGEPPYENVEVAISPSEALVDSLKVFYDDSSELIEIENKYGIDLASNVNGTDIYRAVDKVGDALAREIQDVSFRDRWLLLASHAISKLAGDAGANEGASQTTAKDNVDGVLERLGNQPKLYRVYRLKRDEHYLKLAAMAQINYALLDENLYLAIQKCGVPKLEKMLGYRRNSGGGRASGHAGPGGRGGESDGDAFDDTGRLLSTEERDDIKARISKLNELIEKAELWASNSNDPGQLMRFTNLNRDLLISYFGTDIVFPKDKSKLAGNSGGVSITVVTDPDQAVRVSIFWWSACVFVLAGFLVNLNATSIEGYSRNRIAKTWIADCDGFGRQIPLARLDTTARGYPYHLVSATASFPRRKQTEKASTGHFLFSNLYCGSDRTGYQATAEYCGGSYDLARAIALSGAAVSPMQGIKNLVLVILLFVMNFRLEQWLPNPGFKPWRPKWLSRLMPRWPAPFLVAGSLLRESESRAYCLVTDGGHHDNLGIGPLLDRRCRVIVLSDVAYDPHYNFRDFIEIMQRQRVDRGVMIRALDGGVFTFDDLLPRKSSDDDSAAGGAGQFSKSHFAIAKIIYSNHNETQTLNPQLGPSEGYLIYVKPTLTGDESADVAAHKRMQPEFPQDSIVDQFYPPEKFEAYRQLGFDIGEQLCQECFREAILSDWQPNLGEKDAAGKESADSAQDSPVAAAEPTAPRTSGTTLEQLRDADPERKHALLEALDAELDQQDLPASDRERMVAALASLLEARDEAADVREMVAQILLRHAASDRQVQDAASALSQDRSEAVQIRLKAIELLAATAATDKAARKVLKKLKSEPEPQIVKAVDDIPIARRVKQSAR